MTVNAVMASLTALQSPIRGITHGFVLSVSGSTRAPSLSAASRGAVVAAIRLRRCPARRRRPRLRPPDRPRVGLRGSIDAAEASWNLKVVSKTPPSDKFVGTTNSDLAFTGNYAIQGNYNGYQIWDISNPSQPTLKTAYYCPASQSDVSVYQNLLFVSGEGNSAAASTAATRACRTP